MGSLNNLNTPDDAKIVDENGAKHLPPFRRFYEPLPQVYNGAGAEALAELKANYESLLAQGCLEHIGQTQNGAKVYNMSIWCMQKSFFARAGAQVLLIGLFLHSLRYKYPDSARHMFGQPWTK